MDRGQAGGDGKGKECQAEEPARGKCAGRVDPWGLSQAREDWAVSLRCLHGLSGIQPCVCVCLGLEGST